MDLISDCVLLKIFNWLEIPVLAKCSQVSHNWRRVAYDSELWMDVDLCPFRWKLDENLIIRLISTRLKPFLRKLNLTSFSLTPKLFSELATSCPHLQSLILENVNFIGFCNYTNNNQQQQLQDQTNTTYTFPSNLRHLDIRYSSGDPTAYEVITNNLTNLRSIGITNSLLAHVSNVKIIKNLRNIQMLDFSHCNLLYDATLVLLATFCTQLTSLSLNHCNNVRGHDLSLIIEACSELKALSFSGTSLDDASLIQCDWKKINLEELDISWCRNITERGLLQVLPLLDKLVYLRLCSCGYGHAITDGVLQILWGHQTLQLLDVSYSREITNGGVSKTIAALPALKQIRINSCRKLTPNSLSSMTCKENVQVIPFFIAQERNSVNSSASSLPNKITVSITQSSSRAKKYSLDNILQRSHLRPK